MASLLQDVTLPLDVLAGRESGYGLQRLFSNAKTPYKSVSPATHGYQTDQARLAGCLSRVCRLCTLALLAKHIGAMGGQI